MPKVFRPKLTQATAKPNSGETRLNVHTPDPPRSESLSSPKLLLHQKSPSEITVSPPDFTPVLPLLVQQSSSAVDIDYTAPAKVPISPKHEVQLFAPRKIRRQTLKAIHDPPPAPDQPLDRSTVSLRSLLNWIPSNKPPPSYRQNRLDRTSSVLSSPVVAKEELSSSRNFITLEKVKPPNELATASSSSGQVDVLAPQLRLDANGNIVLDETSLVLSLPETPKDGAVRHVSEDTGILGVTYSSFRRPPDRSGRRWSEQETVRFYRALSTIGPDFYLMSKLFPNRSRGELKRKFNREAKTNPYLVNDVLRNRRSYDLTAFVSLSDEEDEKPQNVEAEGKLTKKKRRKPSGTASKLDSIMDTIDAVLAQCDAPGNAGDKRQSTSPNSMNLLMMNLSSAKNSRCSVPDPLQTMIDRKRSELAKPTSPSGSLPETALTPETIPMSSSDTDEEETIAARSSAGPRVVGVPRFDHGPKIELLTTGRRLLGE
ncbi:unnamed protein product [Calicophoron daubneyi]|uniref:Myb-like domain-containing protein n=1 Tax=Calicophoron daubneyi TaxID=300641 RepID=A0AAV2T9E4_CALDB